MIDFRTVFRSRTDLDALAQRSPRGLGAERALTHAWSGAQLPPVGLDEHVQAWTGVLDRHGVSHAVTLAGGYEELDVVAEAAERSAGRLIAFAPFDASAPDAAERAAALVGSKRFAGVVLSPAIDGYRASDDAFAPAFHALSDHGAVVVVQCGLPHRDLERAFGIPTSFQAQYANPLDLLALADRHRDLPLVVAHLGSGYLRELLMVASHCDNVYADTSNALTGMSAQTAKISVVDVMQRAIDVMGPNRVLFGSGSENPAAGWRHEALLRQREALGACSLSEEESALVFDGNARRLLGLPVPEPQKIPTAH